jgi:hypothetical protein
MNILQALSSIFAAWFKDNTWRAWCAFLAGLFALPMSDDQAEIFKRHTGRTSLPTKPAREGWLIVGRRGGKSLIAALVAVYLACFRNYLTILGPGETATVMLLSADRRQSRTIMRYISGFFAAIPMLSALVLNRTKESIELSNRVVIEIHTASFRSTRGYTLAAVICDEIAFWRSDESANPDTEIINALRPGLSTIPGALLLCISSPYARRGALWQAYQKHYGKNDDPILVWQADTLSMNPSIDPSIIEQAYEEDEASAAAEYGAEFRRDIESFVAREAVEACTVPERRELAFIASYSYVAFVDPSGGSSDSFTLAIAHKEGGKAVLDIIREHKPPFSPESVVSEYADIITAYHCRKVFGDRYAGEWPREQFRKHGIEYLPCDKNKSEIYRDLLPMLNSEKAELLDNPRLAAQLCSLERRTARGGKDSIDHAPNAHDDLVNAAAGALVKATSGFQREPGDIGIS